MRITDETVERLRTCVRPERLTETAMQLIEIPSPTRSAGAVADRLAEILRADGFLVERPVAGWSDAPAVVARWEAGPGGRTLQFNGHLDTVHLPFVPPRITDGVLFGSGASDMKGGIAAAVEAMRALREAAILERGGLLLTAHDLHEAPWGDGSQRTALIDEGYVGDGVLLPEYVADRLPVIGRGLAVWQVEITREGAPMHEVLGGIEQPNVIEAGAELIQRCAALDRKLAENTHPLGGRDSIFIGQVAAGEIYNQSPTSMRLAGTRRWLPGPSIAAIESELRSVVDEAIRGRDVQAHVTFQVPGEAFELASDDALVQSFQAACEIVSGQMLPPGPKPFVDDGNTFIGRGGVPAITHGPAATGAHTVDERVPVAELVRVAVTYAVTAIAFCSQDK